jgi:hypothetical protein
MLRLMTQLVAGQGKKWNDAPYNHRGIDVAYLLRLLSARFAQAGAETEPKLVHC